MLLFVFVLITVRCLPLPLLLSFFLFIYFFCGMMMSYGSLMYVCVCAPTCKGTKTRSFTRPRSRSVCACVCPSLQFSNLLISIAPTNLSFLSHMSCQLALFSSPLSFWVTNGQSVEQRKAAKCPRRFPCSFFIISFILTYFKHYKKNRK